jgi:hypothetical protein
MANDNPGATNPNSVVVTPVQNVIPPAPQQPLASGARVNFGTLGQIPSKPTPITPIRRK